jgi:hypothetical protein
MGALAAKICRSCGQISSGLCLVGYPAQGRAVFTSVFNSDRSLVAQQAKSVHTRTISTSTKEKKVTTPSEPPFPGASGEWVLRKDFPFDRDNGNFGRFKCGKCGNKWTSAHSWKKNHQECKKCDTGAFPSWMWLKVGKQPHDNRSADDRLPHDDSRCGKCIELRKSGRHEKCTELRKSGRHV